MATKVADLLVNIGADTSDLKKELKAVQRQLNYAFGREGMSLSRNAALGITAVGAALAGVAVYAVKAGGELQNVQTAMTNMLGSTEKADQMIRELQDFAAHTPFEFKDVTLASQKFLAFGFTAEQIIPTLTAVGDAAAGVGAGQDGVNRLTVALGQIAAKGKLASQEMMQVTELGIPAWQMLAQYLGTDVAEAQDRVSKGVVDSQMALEALVGGMESRYAGMMDAQSKTVLGAWSNLMDGVEQTAMQTGLAISEALNLPEVFSTAGEARKRTERRPAGSGTAGTADGDYGFGGSDCCGGDTGAGKYGGGRLGCRRTVIATDCCRGGGRGGDIRDPESCEDAPGVTGCAGRQ